jgi:hypothetical protein
MITQAFGQPIPKKLPMADYFSPEPEERIMTIREQLKFNDSRLALLEDGLCELIGKLEPIRTLRPVNEKAMLEEPSEPQSEVLQDLIRQADKINHLIYRLNTLINSIHL